MKMNSRHRFAQATLVLSLLACAEEPRPEPVAQQPVCSAPEITGRLPSALFEASGLAASASHPGVLWVVTDGGAPILNAIDSTGNIRSRIRVRGATKRDWESLAIARCGQRDCLYIGDIGDNMRERSAIAIYRLIEPSPTDSTTAPADRFVFRYPDGPHDAEAIFVLPGEQLFVITKGRSEPISVYRAPGPLSNDSIVALELVQPLSASFVQLPDMVTGAGATSDGRWVVLRTYSGVQLYRFEAGSLQPVLPGNGVDLQALGEFQGEGVDLRADGTIVLLSEKGLGDGNAPVSRVRCDLTS